MTDKFSSIKPYSDHEVNGVLNRIIANDNFIDALQSQQNQLAKFIPFSKFFLKKYMLRLIKDINSVDAYQLLYEKLIKDMISSKIDNFNLSGLDNIDPEQNYLFISNHRDITLDPALLNYAIFQHGHKTFNIAIGDNLIKDSWVSDLMRLNKSFIIKRSGNSKKEIYKSLKLASEFIGNKILNSYESVCIAQRQGRAKDGIDRTDPALLKMLCLAKRELKLSGSLNALHIVPVSISYEYDACDVLKARELYEIEKHGSFTKTDESDITSIVTGMIGFKGNVHVAFGEELNLGTDDPDEIAAIVDEQIIGNYQLNKTNYLALEHLKKDGLLLPHRVCSLVEGDNISASARLKFEKRLESVDVGLRKHWLFNYANPVLNKLGVIK